MPRRELDTGPPRGGPALTSAHGRSSLASLTAVLTFLLATPLPVFQQDTTEARYAGERGELRVEIPRLPSAPTIDGDLSEEAWRGAAVLTEFSQHRPVDGVAAEDPTEVLVGYTSGAVYFGVRAGELHGSVNAHLADRDRIGDDDHVQILLDTFDDGRRAYVFGVNPLGVQADGIRVEGEGGGGGLLSTSTRTDPTDLNPDFLYASRGERTAEGFVVELEIPFESLRYQSAEVQDWRLNVIRRIQHSGRELTWAPVSRDRASFLGQSGTLAGLRGLDRGLVLDLNPVTTANVDGARRSDGWGYGELDPEVGLNATWSATSNLTVVGTVNPDFSQVEADAGRLSFDPRSDVFFPEKRPFFQEGSEKFSAPNNLVYTRRIADPVGAMKLTGTAAGLNLGILSAVDRREPTDGQTDHPRFQVVRLERDVAEESTLGMVYTDRVRPDGYNRVAGVDTDLILGGLYRLQVQGAASFTGREGSSRWGPLWDLGVERTGRSFGWEASFRAIAPEFAAESGFLRRTGVVDARLSPRVTLFGAEGSTIESWTGDVSLSGTWGYDDLFGGDGPEALKLHFGTDFSLRGGWQAGASLLIERFYYPPELYEDVAVEVETSGGRDTVPFTGTPSIANYDLVLRGQTPDFGRFGARGVVIAGRDENFDEWAPAYILILDGGVNWRPDDQLRVEGTYVHQQYVRPDDRTTVRVRRVPRLKVEYQATRAVFVRLVGEYDTVFRDALRDDTRTGGPLLVRDPETGAYVRTTEQRTNTLQVDALFSFEPSPGTVVFAGYGSSLSSPAAFGLSDLSRTRDGFFLKLSYLFRL